MNITSTTTGDGPAVVPIHGVPGSSGVWAGVTERLADDHRVIAPDLLGFGASPGGPGIDALWADAQARALAEHLEDLGIERAALVGHDFGGPVALALNELRPGLATHLVLCATNAFPDTPIPLPIRAVTWPLVGDLAARALFSAPSLRMTLRQGRGDGAPALDESVWLGDARQRSTIRTIFTAALQELEERYSPLEESLETVRCPTLVAWGDQDPFFPVELGRRTAAALDDARFVVFEDCGHFVPAEQPGRLAREIRKLVREPVPVAS